LFVLHGRCQQLAHLGNGRFEAQHNTEQVLFLIGALGVAAVTVAVLCDADEEAHTDFTAVLGMSFRPSTAIKEY
jgi:hypothetical protein